MNDPHDDRPDDGSAVPAAAWESWSELDDTLADGPAPASVPAPAREWLADQRFVHGLLRTLHTADAQAREARIDAVLERTRPEASASRRWVSVVAAAALLCLAVLWAVTPPRTLSAEAAVQRALSLLAENVDRRYLLDVTIQSPLVPQPIRNQLTLTSRPGLHFRLDGRLEFGGPMGGSLQAGCDGEHLWFTFGDGLIQREVALADAHRLPNQFRELLEPGVLDVHALLRLLPESATLTHAGEERGPAGERLLRIDAQANGVERGRIPFSAMRLWYDDATGMVVRIDSEFVAKGGASSRRMELRYQGVVTDVDYRRPW